MNYDDSKTYIKIVLDIRVALSILRISIVASLSRILRLYQIHEEGSGRRVPHLIMRKQII